MTAVTEPPVYFAAHSSRKADAENFCRQFNLTLSVKPGKASFRLYLDSARMELQDLRDKGPGPVFVDFSSGQSQFRRASTGKQQPLPRAIGVKSRHYPAVIDVTAGLGKDAFVLAALGCHVTLVERSPVFAALLADGLARGALDLSTADIVQRMHLVHADSNRYLAALQASEKPDVIYMDPMYPHRSKSALVKKDMRFARAVVGEDSDADTLLKNSIDTAKQRVVVKRPRNAEPLPGAAPSAQIFGKTTRYDVYVTKLFHHNRQEE